MPDRFEALMNHIRKNINDDEQYILIVSRYDKGKNNYKIAARMDHNISGALEVLLTTASQLNDQGEKEDLFKKVKPVTVSNLYRK